MTKYRSLAGMSASKAFALYDSREYQSARTIFEELSRTTKDASIRQDCLFNAASCLASEGNYVRALEALSKMTTENKTLDVLHNKALCNYELSRYDVALQQNNELLILCREKYPELWILRGTTKLLSNQDDVMDQLQASYIIEGLNLKSAILYKLNQNPRESLTCLNEIPMSGDTEQLDCVTLHNQAIYECDTDLYISISKLNHLVGLINSQNQEHSSDDLGPFVPLETFKNLLLLCMSNSKLEILSNIIKTNELLFRKYLSTDWYRFLEIYLEQSFNPEELIFRKLDLLLDQLLGKIKDCDKLNGDDRTNDRIELIELTTIIATHESLILWNNGQHDTLEKVFAKVEPYLTGRDSIGLLVRNMAHNLFMMDSRYEESAEMYEKLLPQSTSENFNNIDSMILGNLCVAYVLTGRNSEAEVLIKDIETDEEAVIDELRDTIAFGDSRTTTDYQGKFPSNLSIVNIVIGTLYCVKFNYEFGLSRMFKSLVPIEHKLNTRAWFYVKRCILSLLDCHCKQMICVKDDLLQQVVSFLIQCEKYGTSIEAIETTDSNNLTVQEVYGRNSVTFEARYVRSIVLTVIHN